MYRLFLLLALLLIPFTAQAQIFVDAGNTASTKDGTTWAKAYDSLNLAISGATAGDTIVVKGGGTFKPTRYTNRTKSFTIDKALVIYGGFAGTETGTHAKDILAARPANFVKDTLSGDIGTVGTDSDNSYHVVVVSVAGATLDGFAITKGQADGASANNYHSGGGVYMTADATLRNLEIHDNATATTQGSEGGGVYLNGGTITHSLIHHNESYNGGGLNLNGGSVLNCAIYSNTASNASGGVSLIPTPTNSSLLVNSTIYDNTAASAGGVYIGSGGVSKVYNSLIYGNTASNVLLGYEVFGANASATFEYNLVKGADAAAAIKGTALSATPNCIFTTTSPFASTTTTAANFLHLTGTTEALNVGDNSQATWDLDLAGNARIQGGTVDMGAYEARYVGKTIYVDAASTYSTTSDVGTTWAKAYDSLHLAIAGTNAGDTIFVKGGGLFKPTNKTDRNISFTIDKAIYIYGGLAGTETGTGAEILAARPANFVQDTLSGDIGDADPFTGTLEAADPLDDNSRHVVTISADGAVLDGFVVTGGRADRNGSNLTGAGIQMTGNSTLRNLELYNNTTTSSTASGGGGVYMTTGTLTHSVIHHNASANGGGLYVGGDAKAFNCVIHSNQMLTEGYGGGVYVAANSTALLVNNTIHNNSNNIAGLELGGGLYIDSNNTGSKFYNNLIYGNTVPSASQGHEVYNSTAGATFENNLVKGTNAADAIKGTAFTATPGCVFTTTDPFVSTTETERLFLRLNATTAALDAGANAQVTWALDLAGNARITDDDATSGAVVDIGAYEGGFVPPAITAIAVSKSSVEDKTLANEVIGTLSATHASLGTEPVITFAIKDADTATDTLKIEGNVLKTNKVIDREKLLGSHTVTIVATHTPAVGSAITYEEAITITITERPFRKVIYVAEGATGLKNGSSWANAYDSLQFALAAAVDEDSIFVKSGTYKPSLPEGYQGFSRDNSFNLNKAVKVFGSFAGTEAHLGERNLKRTGFTQSILSGYIQIGTGLNAKYSKRVVNMSANHAVLDGFAITAGNGGGGAGLRMTASDTARNLEIYDNSNLSSTSSGGAGVYMSAGLLEYSVIRNNETGLQSGAGIYMIDGTVRYCVIHSNTQAEGGEAGAVGIGIYVNVRGLIFNNAIYSNDGLANASGGGGIYAEEFPSNSSGTIDIINNTIYGNDPGGLFIKNRDINSYNNVIWGNGLDVSTGLGGSYSTFEHNYLGASSRARFNSSNTLTGSIFSNTSPYTITNDVSPYHLRLRPGSGALDAGDDTKLPAGTTLDLAGRARVSDDDATSGAVVDMGAYEGAFGVESIALTKTSVEDGTASGVEIATLSATTVNIGDNPNISFTIKNANLATDTLRVEGNSLKANKDINQDLLNGAYTTVIRASWPPASAAPLIYDSQKTITITDYVTKTIYVDANASGAKNGRTWTDAFDSLNVPLRVARAADTIFVKGGGTFKPTPYGHRDRSFTLDKAIAVYGGFAGTETGTRAKDILAKRPANFVKDTLSGDIGTVGTDTDNSYHVVQVTAEGAVLDGFAITKGQADGANTETYDDGGGVYMTANSTLRNLEIYDNATATTQGSQGGGVHMSAGTLTHSIIRNNESNLGGGIDVRSTAKILNCVIYSNTSSSAGGGIFASGSSITANNTIYNNTSSDLGGGAYVNLAGTKLYNNLIYGNTASDSDSGNEVYVGTDGAGATFSHNLVKGADKAAAIKGTIITSTPGCIFTTTSPFASTTATDANFLHLTSSAEALNVGLNAQATWDLDLAGAARIRQETVDIGAYEGFEKSIKDITLSVSSVAHLVAADVKVADLSATTLGLGANPTITYTLKDANTATDTFKVVGSELKTNKVIDYDKLNASHSPITLVATHTPTGEEAITYEEAFTITITAPTLTGIALAGNAASPGGSAGDRVGTLTATGTHLPTDGHTGITFTLESENDGAAAYFQVGSGNELQVKKALVEGTYNLVFKAAYIGVEYTHTAIQVSVTSAPSITDILLSPSVVAHLTAADVKVGDISASHANLADNPTITYSIKNANAATDTFKVVGSELKTNKAIDYELLHGSHSPITLVASHTPQGGSAVTYEEAVTITITPPAITGITLSNATIGSNASVDTEVGVLRASGTHLPRRGEGIVFTIAEGNDADYFKIADDSVLQVASALQVGTYNLKFTATYLGVSYTSATAIAVTVTNVGITDITLSASVVAHLTAADVKVGDLSVTTTGLGVNPTITYSLKDADAANDTFKVVGAELKTNKAIDYELLHGSHSAITIVASHTPTSGEAVSYEKPFTVTITPPTLTGIVLDGNVSSPGGSAGDRIGTLTATGTHLPTDGHTGITFTLESENDGAATYFQVGSGNELQVKTPLVAGNYNLVFKASYIGVEYTHSAIQVQVTTDASITDILLSSSEVAHLTAADVKVADLSSSHANLGDNPTITYSIKNADTSTDTFKIVGSELRTNKLIDYGRLNGAHSPITIVASHTPQNGSAVTYEEAFTITITSPTITGVTPTTFSVVSGSAVDALVGKLTAKGTLLPSDGSGVSYAITGGNTDNVFKIDGASLKVASTVPSTQTSYTLQVKASYLGITQATATDITISVVEDAEITGVTFDDGASEKHIDSGTPVGTLVGVLKAVGTGLPTDVSGIEYRITDGDTDPATFEIEGNALKVKRVPLASEKLNYALKIQASYAGVTGEGDINIGISYEITAITTDPASLSVAHGTAANTDVATLSATHKGLGTNPSIAYSIKDFNASSSPFKVDANKLKTNLLINKTQLGASRKLTLVATHTPTGGSAVTKEQEVTIAITGSATSPLGALNASGIYVYPNPTTGLLHLRSAIKVKRLRLLDAKGTVVLRAKRSNTLNISTLASGTYILELVTAEGNLRLPVLRR